MSESLSPLEDTAGVNQNNVQPAADQDCENNQVAYESPDPDPKGEAAGPASEEMGQEELITIIVEIGEGREESIVVYAGDRAENLAAKFAQNHGLDGKMQEKLTTHIQQNIDQALLDIALEEEEKNRGKGEIKEEQPEEQFEREDPPEPEAKLMEPDIVEPRADEGELHEIAENAPDKEFERWQAEMEKNMKASIRSSPTPVISENSRKMASGVALNNLPVHQRLHIQAMNKQKVERRTKEEECKKNLDLFCRLCTG